MRFTIPGEYAAHARQIARLNTTTRADWWRTVRRGDLLNGLMGRDHLPPVHRERVRFGAWESRPRVTLSQAGRYQAAFAPVVLAFRALVESAMDFYLQNQAALAATGRLTPGTGGSEGPPVSGPENAYKCAHCGRVLGSFEAGIARIGTDTVCHPNDDGPDCYRLVTVYGEKLGARR